jgi:pimeloyl-ACP methyl ester carboxylesterase
MKHVTSKDGTQITYDTYGSGPALIYVLGALCYRKFEPAVHDANVFSKDFTVYLYDRRGRGDSGDTLPFAKEKEIEDLEALIQAAGGSAFLYGHSSGASLALEATAQLRNKVTKLAMYEAPYSTDEASQREAEEYDAELKALLDDGKRGDAVAAFMRMVGMPDEAIEGAKHSPSWKALEALAHTLAYDSAFASKTVPVEIAKTIEAPTLIMAGGNSYEFMKPVAESLRESIPNAQMQIIEGQDHNISSDILFPVLKEFFLRQ